MGDLPSSGDIPLTPEEEAALSPLHYPGAKPPEDDYGPPPDLKPIREHPSDLLDLIRTIPTAGWPAVRDKLVNYDYADEEEPAGSPMGEDHAGWWSNVEAVRMGPAADNSWGQLKEAVDHGLMTDAQYTDLLTARAAARAR